MIKALIAYNDDVSETNRNNFEEYATDVRNFCIENEIDWELLTPPNLTNEAFMKLANESQVCYISAHGSPVSIDNERKNHIISTRTTNYNLCGKMLYAVSCHCALQLKDELMRIGLKIFVGYRSIIVFTGYEEFLTCFNSGIKALIKGCTVAEMRKLMKDEYDKQFHKLGQTNPLAADMLLDNKESLVIDGKDSLTIYDLNLPY